MENITITQNEALAVAAAGTTFDQLVSRIAERVQETLDKNAAAGPGPAHADAGDQVTVAQVIRFRLQAIRLEEKNGSLSPDHVVSQVRYLNAFETDFGKKIINACRSSDLTQFLTNHPEWESNHTRNDAVSVVVRAFRRAAEEREIPFCPYHKPRKLIGPLRPRMAIREEQYRAIMNAARAAGRRWRRKVPTTRHRRRLKRGEVGPGKGRKSGTVMCAGAFRRLLWFLWETGARTCEVSTLEWAWIDWQRCVAVLTDHKTAKATDTAKDRIIPLSDRVMRLLRLMYKHRNPQIPWVFLSTWKKRAWNMNQFAKLFRRFAREVGVDDKISAYSCRHGFTVAALEAGLGNKQIADVLGHASTRYVDWYGRTAKTNTEYLRANANQVHGRKKRG